MAITDWIVLTQYNVSIYARNDDPEICTFPLHKIGFLFFLFKLLIYGLIIFSLIFLESIAVGLIFYLFSIIGGIYIIFFTKNCSAKLDKKD